MNRRLTHSKSHFYFQFKISIMESRYAIWQDSKKSVRGEPRHPRVVNRQTIASEKFFRCKIRHFGGQICDLVSFWKIDLARPEAPNSRRPAPHNFHQLKNIVLEGRSPPARNYGYVVRYSKDFVRSDIGALRTDRRVPNIIKIHSFTNTLIRI